MTDTPNTYFADPRRATPLELERQIQFLCDHPVTTAVLQSLGGAAVILNNCRQTVAANDKILELLGLHDAQNALGLRPGEAFNCVQADLAPNGCGTGRACASCGAVLSIIACRRLGHAVEEECLLTRKNLGVEESLEFRVRSTPLSIGESPFTVVTLLDIHEAKRSQTLERIFLHDALNYLQGLRGACELFLMEQPRSEQARQILELVDYLTETTLDHRDIILMENGEYQPREQVVSVRRVIERVVYFISFSKTIQNRELVVDPVEGDPSLCLDGALLVRILVNMVKNALEAVPVGGKVRLFYEYEGDMHRFNVWNPGKIDDALVPRIFQRYFTTKKGRGRGLGTYSMKLLGERFLGGKVRFTTGEDGTTFQISLR